MKIMMNNILCKNFVVRDIIIVSVYHIAGFFTAHIIYFRILCRLCFVGVITGTEIKSLLLLVATCSATCIWMAALRTSYKESISSCVRSYHIYKEIWTTTIGEILRCLREPINVVDRYADWS